MKRTVFIVLAIFAAQLCAKGPNKIPMKDFFRNAEKEFFYISPDGTKVSFLASYKNRMSVFLQDVELKEPAYRLTQNARDIWTYTWKGNDHILYLNDSNGDENNHIFCAELSTKKVTDLTPFKGVKSYILDDLQGIKDNIILIGMNKRDNHVFDVYSLNIITGKLILKAVNPGGVTEWVTDHNGTLRIGYGYDGINRTVYYRKSDDKQLKKIFSTNFKNTFDPLAFTPDNKNLYVESNIGTDKSGLVIYDISKGKEVKTLFRHPVVDIDGINYSEKRKVLLKATYSPAKKEYFFFDKEAKRMYERIKSELPKDFMFDFLSHNDNEDKFTLWARSDRTYGAYYLYDVKKDELKKLADDTPWLKPEDMAHMQPIEYVSRDGIKIHGYLTLPNDLEAKNLPVVVVPHGGPWLRNRWKFDQEVQFFANRGYAVLQMNFRGSVGYGKKLHVLGFKQWGLKMQDDITDGVNWLIGKGIADPKKVAIYGGSYGGYAVLAGLTFTPDLYACGVDYVGISNLFTDFKTMPAYWKPYLEMNYEMVGNPTKDKKLLEKISPLFHADKIKVPLFIAQGANDPRVNKNESQQMVDALKKRGIKVPYMLKQDEGHGFNNEENRLEYYDAVEKFLAECIGSKS